MLTFSHVTKISIKPTFSVQYSRNKNIIFIIIKIFIYNNNIIIKIIFNPSSTFPLPEKLEGKLMPVYYIHELNILS